MTFQLQWTRDGVDIPGATANSYVVQTADRGHTLAFRVVALNAKGSTTATSPGKLIEAITLSGTPSANVTVGNAYSFTPSVAGGTAPYSFAITSGALPAGLTLDAATGAISGTATTAETKTGIVLTVTDAIGVKARLTAFTITVAAVIVVPPPPPPPSVPFGSDVDPSNWWAALQAAPAGTTLTMAPGNYGDLGLYGISKAAPGVTLQGQAGVTCNWIEIDTVSGLNVTGVTVSGLRNGQYAISVGNSDRVTIDRCTIPGNNPGALHTGLGIFGRNCTNLAITNNTLSNLGDGIDGLDCTNLTISGNNITKYSANAIFWQSIHTAVIEKNYVGNIDVLDPGTHPDSIQISSSGSTGRSSSVTIRYNHYDAETGVAAQGIGFCEDVDGLTITGNCSFGSMTNGQAVARCTNVSITDNFDQGWTYSPVIIARGASDQVTITGNSVPSTPTAIEACTNVTIGSNTIIPNASGASDTNLRNTWLAAHPLVPVGSTATGSTGGASSGPASVVYDFVGHSFTGGAASDLSVVQAATRVEPDNTGARVSYAANTLRLDAQNPGLGLAIDGSPVTYCAAHPLRPVGNWTATGSGASLATAAGQATTTYPAPAKFTGSSASFDYVELPMATTPSIGQTVTVQVALKSVTAGQNAQVTAVWSGGSESWRIADLAAASGTPPVINQSTFSDTSTVSTVVNIGIDGDGACVFAFRMVVPASGFKVRLSTDTDGSNRAFYVMAADVVTAPFLRPWLDNGSGGQVQVADVVTVGAGSPLAGVLAAASFNLLLELGPLHRTSATGPVVGDILTVGSNHLLAANGSTTSTANGATAMHGLGGYRGITRLAITADATGWAAAINNGPVARATGALGLSGTIKLLAGVSGRLRRIEASPARLSDTALQALSALEQHVPVSPGNSLAPALARTTLDITDFSTALAHRTSWSGGSESAMSALYAASWNADKRRLLKPRPFFYTASANGTATAEAINGEPQMYVDYDASGSFPAVSVNGAGELVLQVQRYSNLTAGQKALVNTDPATGQPFAYVSGEVTSWANNPATEGGFKQSQGVFSARVKPPKFPGAWPAVWRYEAGTTAEDDFMELYMAHPEQFTASVHDGNFSYNQSNIRYLGFDQSQEMHDYAVVHTPGTVKRYIDGELVCSQATDANFDTAQMFLLANVAIHSSTLDGTTAGILDAQDDRSRMRVSRLRALQFS